MDCRIISRKNFGFVPVFSFRLRLWAGNEREEEMKVALITFAMAFRTIQAGEPAPVEPATVTVCTQLAASKGPQAALRIASEILATADVKIDWHARLSNCPTDGIKVTLRFDAPPDEHPGALAYALPFEGAHICVFYDRIAQQGYALLPRLMGHVIAHEITHMLQDVVQHSRDGLMKAQWSKRDLAQMRDGNLRFESADIERVRLGFAARRTRFEGKMHLQELAVK
jgi:hypothetical protein